MKKTLILFLGLTLILTGCTSKKDSPQPIDKRNLTFNAQTITFEGQTETYDLPKELNVYYTDELGEALPYVSLEVFFQFLKTEIEKNKDVSNLQHQATGDLFTLTFEYYDEDNDETFTYELKLDALKQTLYLSEPNVVNSLVQSNAYDEDNFNNITYKNEIVVAPSAVEVDLSTYQVFTYTKDNQLIVPLYFANFLLSGYDLEVANYFDGKTNHYYTFSVNDLMRGESDFDKTKFSDVTLEEKDFELLKDESANYLWMLMDEFYGLKDFQDVQSYEDDIFSKKGVANAKDQKEYQAKLNEFLFGLNDLHTSAFQNGIMNIDYTPAQTLFTSNKYYYDFIVGMQNAQCYDVNPDDLTLKSYDFDQTLYIELYSFDGNVRDEMDKVMSQNQSKENVFIDIRCNGGGFVNDVNHVLKYLSTDAWSFYSGALDGSQGIATVTVDEPVHVDRQYFLVTSEGTFSAANYLATVVKDEGLATIVGQDSYGGTCSVEVATLPDGTTLSRSSSSFCLMNNQFNYVEGGIEVDKKIGFSLIKAASYEQFLKAIVEGSLSK